MRKFAAFLLNLSILIAQMACSPQPPSPPPTQLATPSPILLSPFALTGQAAQAQAQSTIAAGQAISNGIEITLTAISIEQLQVDMAITQAAFTQQAQARQTATAHIYTATAQAKMAAAAEAHALATRQAIASATAWPQTATPLAATEIAIAAQATGTERKLYWQKYVAPFLIFVGATSLGLIVLAIALVFKRLLPVWELRLRTIVSPDGETITYLPADEDVKLLLPGRSFGAALHSGKDETVVSGAAPDPALQDRVVARNQAIRLTASLPPGRSSQQVRQLLASPQDGDSALSQDLPLIEVVDAEVIPVKNWVEEISAKFLEEE